MIQKGTEYQNNSTKEQCELTSFDTSSCSYDCYCSGTGTKKRCSTCYSTRYTYYATVESKCGTDVTLKADGYYSSSCEYANLLSMGSSHTCYVLDCDEKEFS